MRLERLGHTGITWPFTPAGAKQALQEVADVGYRGVELFGFVLDAYPGDLEAVKTDLTAAGVEYVASYCSVSLVDPEKRENDLASMQRWARQVKALGGDTVVVGPSPRERLTYSPEDYRTICRSLDEIGRRCADLGVVACFHPHTGTPVETREEIGWVMDGIDPDVVSMAPDTGQIAKGGGDPVEVLRTYRELVRHVHLKDYVGGAPEYDARGELVDRTGYLDYVPIGRGTVDVPGIIEALGPGYSGWWMVELDGTEQAPQPAKAAAADSKRYLDGLPEPAMSSPDRGA